MLFLQYVVALHEILVSILNNAHKCILQHKDMVLGNIRLLSLNAVCNVLVD